MVLINGVFFTSVLGEEAQSLVLQSLQSSASQDIVAGYAVMVLPTMMALPSIRNYSEEGGWKDSPDDITAIRQDAPFPRSAHGRLSRIPLVVYRNELWQSKTSDHAICIDKNLAYRLF